MGIEKREFEFHIIPMDGFEKLFPQEKSVTNLMSALGKNGSKVNVEDFPYPVRDGWCYPVMSVRREIVVGKGWSGLRWIGGFGGDESYPSCALSYVFNGISEDGRYLIVLRADISHADHKRFMPPRQVNGSPGHTWESSDPKIGAEMRERPEKSLTAADPSSFQPNLDELDGVLHSLKFKQ